MHLGNFTGPLPLEKRLGSMVDVRHTHLLVVCFHAGLQQNVTFRTCLC